MGKKLGDYYFSLGMKVFSTGEYRKGLSDLSFFQILTKKISSHEAHFIMRKTITVEINIYLFT